MSDYNILINKKSVRTFEVMPANGTLLSPYSYIHSPPFAGVLKEPWLSSVKKAQCKCFHEPMVNQKVWSLASEEERVNKKHDTTPSNRGGCGIYSVHTIVQLKKLIPIYANNCIAVVEPSGWGEIGSGGIKSEIARIESVWVGPQPFYNLAHIEKRYPDVNVYSKLESLMNDYPQLVGE